MDDKNSTLGDVEQIPVLSWALTIATYNRERVLPICLRLAAEQERPPVEIIVCDASANWQKNRDGVFSDLAEEFKSIRWVYLKAIAGSAAVQRNQAIEASRADVVFVFDDDTLMFPGCAEEIMRIYECDREGFVRGVQAVGVESAPVLTCADGSDQEALPSIRRKLQSERSSGSSEGGFERSLKYNVARQLLLFDPDLLFVPYRSRRFPMHDIPDSLRHLNIRPIKLMVGFKMTYRRAAILEARFEELCRSAGTEDHDASYRVSLQGLLVQANDAAVHHYQAAAGRDAIRKRVAVSIIQQAIGIRRHADKVLNAGLRLYWILGRRVLVSIYQDLRGGRWPLPATIGVVQGAIGSGRVFLFPRTSFEQRCIDLQLKILGRR